MKALIIGGTGTLGKAVLKKLYKPGNEISIISRDEIKQKDLLRQYPLVKNHIADIKDSDSMRHYILGNEVVFHFAASKHIDFCEENPEESIKANINATMNVADLCEGVVPYLVFSSTDKAVLPINTYGMCKAISEKYLFWFNSRQEFTRASVFRWGNVLGSRGSVIHSFVKTLKESKEVFITDQAMTRFWIDIDDAAEFILNNYESAELDRPMIPEMRSSSVLKLAELTAHYLGIKDYKINFTGIRAGEKLHECILSNHDVCVRSDNTPKYDDQALLEMIRKTLCQAP